MSEWKSEVRGQDSLVIFKCMRLDGLDNDLCTKKDTIIFRGEQVFIRQ